jgi:hypothetical protein
MVNCLYYFTVIFILMEPENNNDVVNDKKIVINGQSNRYQMKKVMKVEKTIKKRNEAEKWNLDPIFYTHDRAIEMLKGICNNNYRSYSDESRIVIQEIERKLCSYKQQDIKKGVLNKDAFIEFKNLLDKMIEIDMECYYCKDKMCLLYEMSREQKQWTVDRIDNDLGHNNDNYVLACLDCNLKKRKKSKESFLFTKQMNIIKQN